MEKPLKIEPIDVYSLKEMDSYLTRETCDFFSQAAAVCLDSVHPETALKIPKLKLWTPNNGHLGVQSFSFGSVSGWTLDSVHPETALKIPKAEALDSKKWASWSPKL